MVAGSSRVLLEPHTTLKPGGVLFSSNPRGHNEKGWNSGRYGKYHDLESWRRYMSAGFVELIPTALNPDMCPFSRLASLWRRLAPRKGRFRRSIPCNDLAVPGWSA